MVPQLSGGSDSDENDRRRGDGDAGGGGSDAKTPPSLRERLGKEMLEVGGPMRGRASERAARSAWANVAQRAGLWVVKQMVIPAVKTGACTSCHAFLLHACGRQWSNVLCLTAYWS